MLPIVDLIVKRDTQGVKECLDQGCSANGIDASTDQSLLSLATWTGDSTLVQLLLDAGAEPNMRQSGEWPIIIASSQGYTAIVEALLRAGADVEVFDEERSSALMLAAAGGHLDIVELLLDWEADPEQHDCNGMAAFDYAALKQHRSVTQVLGPLTNSSKFDDTTGDENRTRTNADRLAKEELSILDAAKAGDIAAVKELVATGANIDVADDNGLSALHCVIVSGSTDLLEYLLRAGADPNRVDDCGHPPVYWAARGGCDWAFKRLFPITREELSKPAAQLRDELIAQKIWEWSRPDIDDRYREQPFTKELIDEAFKLAKRSLLPGMESKLYVLLENNPGLAHCIQSDGMTLLFNAVKANNFRLVKYLIEQIHVDPNLTDKSGNFALREARPQPGLRNPSTRKRIFDYLYSLTDIELRKAVDTEIDRRPKKKYL